MESATPAVSIGLPIYNGEPFLTETIESILDQSYSDLELILSDNASTDGTAEICRRFAERDPRVRYSRNPENLGAARNYNITFELARGRYFKWHGHDDPVPPDYLERCIAVLERDPSIVLAYGRQQAIDDAGRPKRTGVLVSARLQGRPRLASRSPIARYLACVATPAGHPVGPIFGVVRRDVLARTPLLGAFVSHDLPLTAELTLHGKFHQLADVPQYRRYHAGQGHRTHRSRSQRESWFDPARANLHTHPRLRLLREHLQAIGRASRDPTVRACCYAGTMIWFLTEVGGIRPAKSLFRGLYRRLRATGAPAEA